MALFSSLYRFPTLISLLLILTSNSFARTNGSPVLEKVCHQTKDESLCLTYLRPEEGSETASLPELLQITIYKAISDATEIKNQIHALIMSSEKNPGLHKLYNTCEEFYLDALDALTISLYHMSKRRYGKIEASGAIVSSSVARCESLFKGEPLFTNGKKELGILGDVIVVIAGNLGRGGNANPPQEAGVSYSPQENF